MKIANTLSSVLGVVLLLIALQWIFMPASAAESLGMLYLEGDGRNTQIRDFTAFFWPHLLCAFYHYHQRNMNIYFVVD